MKDVSLPAIVREGFSITVDAQERIRLKLVGNADMEMLPVLGPYLRNLHESVLKSGAHGIEVDVRELYFMNSSCFKAFVTWIAVIAKLDPAQRYHVRFLANSRLHWQRRNLAAMQSYAHDLVILEVT
jgi:hypothetical protein